jgi:hypothetical protein
MKRGLKILFFIAVIWVTAQSHIWAKDVKLHDINGSVVDTNRIKSIEPPRISSDGRFWILTVYLESQAGPMAIKFQYPAEKGNLARNDYASIRGG